MLLATMMSSALLTFLWLHKHHNTTPPVITYTGYVRVGYSPPCIAILCTTMSIGYHCYYTESEAGLRTSVNNNYTLQVQWDLSAFYRSVELQTGLF